MTTLSISTNANDCRGDASPYFSTSTTTLGIGNFSGSVAKAWMPFVVPIKKGIISATLKIIAVTSGTTVCNVRIGCEDADNPATPTTWNDLNGRTMTSAYHDWDSVPQWSAGVEYTRDVTAAVQEVIDRSGFSAGNTLAVMVFDNSSGTDDNRAFASFDNVTYTEPILEIVYNAAQQAVWL